MAHKNNISLSEAMILALINEPVRTASIKDLAVAIAKRGLYLPRYKHGSIEKEISNMHKKSKSTFDDYFLEIGDDFIRLKESHAYFAITLLNALEELLQIDSAFYYPEAKKISVVSIADGRKETLKVKLRPDKIICIVSEDKGRKKGIYVSKTGNHTPENIICYHINSNKLKFQDLCSYFDPVNGNIVQVSKSKIVNVAYFELESRQKLSFVNRKLKSELPADICDLGKNVTPQFLKNFELVKEAYKRRFLLQKKAFDYIPELTFSKDPQICFLK